MLGANGAEHTSEIKGSYYYAA
ncbi:protein of unknown function [Pseudomonas marincola]|uniref:Uncharacterized protein n=1 Tax=Pseudomonas marincola TaxID=437900 RepID=A0A8S2B9V7_9PSED|nr:protein of unknown function [Pseudomonas marincola]